MSARCKLNRAFFNGSLLLAALAGLAADSWLVFGVALAVLVAANLSAGDICLTRRKR